MIYKTPEEIRKVLSDLGYKAHGRKVKVVLRNENNKPIKAIIHCADVPKDVTMRWYFCQDKYDGGGIYSGDEFGKKYSWEFYDNNECDYVYSLEFIDEKEKSEIPIIINLIFNFPK